MEKKLENKVLLQKTYHLIKSPRNSLTLEVDFITDDDNDPESIHMEQKIVQIDFHGNRIVIGLSGDPITPTDLRRVADLIELSRSHAIRLNEKIQRKPEHRVEHSVFVSVVEFIENGGILQEGREIFVEFQGRFQRKGGLTRYEEGVIYFKEYPYSTKEQFLSEIGYVMCPAEARYN